MNQSHTFNFPWWIFGKKVSKSWDKFSKLKNKHDSGMSSIYQLSRAGNGKKLLTEIKKIDKKTLQFLIRKPDYENKNGLYWLM